MKKKANKFRPVYPALFFLSVSVFFIIEALTAKSLNYHFSFVGWGGTFKPHDLNLFGLPVYYFMMVVAVAISIFVALVNRKRYNRSVLGAILFPVVVFAICFLGGKLLYIVENIKLVKQSGLTLDGFSLFGSIFISVIAAFVASWGNKLKAALWLDEAIFYELIMLAAIRTGCFLNGCCGAAVMWYNSNPVVLPVQLIEVVFDLLILDVCIRVRDSKGQHGRMYPCFLMLYSVMRFFLEFLRNTPKDIWIFSQGQIMSIVGLLLGIVLYKYFAAIKIKKN